MNEEERSRRIQLNKKILKWLFLGGGSIMVVMIIIGFITTKLAESERQEIQKRQDAENRADAERQAILRIRHDSLMKTDKRYADSVRIAQRRHDDSVAMVRRDDSIAADIQERTVNPEEHVKVDLNWEKGGFGSVALASFVFKNESLRTCINPSLIVTFYSDNGTVISSKKADVYLTIPPGKRRKSEQLNLGFINRQATRAGSKMVDATWE